MTVKVEIEGPVATKKTRKFVRPTSPEVEALFFKVAVHCSKREMAMLQWFLGRSAGGADEIADMFLNPAGQDPLP